MCPANIRHVTSNMIIFTSLVCGISHRHGPNHPNGSCVSEIGEIGVTKTRTVGARKQGAWASRWELSELCQFGMRGAD